MTKKLTLLIIALGGVFIVAIGVGNVNIPPLGVVFALLYRLFGIGSASDFPTGHVEIVWYSRLPRVLLAFIVGAALSVSGAVKQSILRNPLASSFTLGVSSGASLGAAIVLFSALPAFFFMPLFGFIGGMGSIVIAIALATSMDRRMENNTIILVGMVLSLFVNAITTLLMALQRETAQQLVLWQMGSFMGRGWTPVYILAPIMLMGTILILLFHRELDIMTFGEEQAQLIGINLKRVKWILLLISSALTGSAIAFSGLIGFVDLVAPHIIRKLFGTRHKTLIPISAIFGGGFMVVCDLVARTITRPGELPVGVVSALVGAPFFAYVYFRRK